MSRNQQKAVFANLGNKSSSVSNMSARRESLVRNDFANESQQDKIDKIMRNNRLTHRQKMDRIAKLKSGGSSRSSASDVGTGESSDAKIDSPAIKLIYQKVLDKAEKRRLQRKTYLKAHPGAVFEPTKKPGVYLLKEKGKTYSWKDGVKTKVMSLGFPAGDKKYNVKWRDAEFPNRINTWEISDVPLSNKTEAKNRFLFEIKDKYGLSKKDIKIVNIKER